MGGSDDAPLGMSSSTSATPDAVPFLTASDQLLPALDGLRAFSILLVLAEHAGLHLVPGGYGVFVFFVISGFLITRLLLAEQKRHGEISLRNFYIRRALRLYPVVVLYVTAVCALALIQGTEFSWWAPLSVLFYFSNFYLPHLEALGKTSLLPIGRFWSLSIEEQFYLVFPVILLLVRTPRRLAAVAMGCILIAVSLRFVEGEFISPLLRPQYFYMHPELRMDSLAYGVLLASLCELRPNMVLALGRHWIGGFLLGLTFLVVKEAPPLGKLVFRDLFMGLFVMVLIVSSVFRQKSGLLGIVLNWPPIVWVGRLSYSLYVWHGLVAFVISPYVSGVRLSLVFLSGSFLLACASYYGVERPLLSLRKRFRPAGTRRDHI
ncbi:MAG TPA: acyltransferase [Rhizomicrobium sp.]|nr:acyltransferase [Rhizomicrobium sp.]